MLTFSKVQAQERSVHKHPNDYRFLPEHTLHVILFAAAFLAIIFMFYWDRRKKKKQRP